jgi:hypothetical protein
VLLWVVQVRMVVMMVVATAMPVLVAGRWGHWWKHFYGQRWGVLLSTCNNVTSELLDKLCT